MTQLTIPSGKTRILFMLPGLDAGGAERVLITLMNLLDEDKYDKALLSVRGQGALQSLVQDHVPFYGLNQRLSPLSYFDMLRVCKKFKPDIIVSTMTHMNFMTLALKPFCPHTRFIVREAITPSFFLEKYESLKHLLKLLYKTLYPLADLVLSPTKLVFDEFEKDINLKLDNMYVLRNPVRIHEIRNHIKMPPIHKDRKKTVKFVACGRLGKQKGFDRLIIALKNFNPSFQWELDILGEGHERTYLESLIHDNGLSNHVFLKGLIIPPYSYFAAADCFLLPSRHEGLPNVALESLACGTPVIATMESGGIYEIQDNAEPESVTVVKSMQDFVHHMGMVKPNPSRKVKTSLLSKAYDKQTILEEFEKIIAL